MMHTWKKAAALASLVALLVVSGGGAAWAQTDKRIALSFDDAPAGDGPIFTGAERADALIGALNAVDAGPAVFFITTRGMAKPEGKARVAKYAAAGHLIANHSHSHHWAHKTDAEEYIADLDRADKWLTGIENRRPWYRFPYLDEGREQVKRETIRAALAQRGLLNGYVTVDTYDWHFVRRWKDAVRDGKSVDIDQLGKVYVEMMADAADFYDKKGREAFGRAPEQVMLLHENDLAALFIDDLVTELRARGWEIIDPDTAYMDPIAEEVPKTLFSGQGKIAALSVDKGISAYDFGHPGANEKAIDERLAEAAVFTEPVAEAP